MIRKGGEKKTERRKQVHQGPVHRCMYAVLLSLAWWRGATTSAESLRYETDKGTKSAADDIFTNDFVVQLAPDGDIFALAAAHELEVREEIFPGHWHLRSAKIHRRSAEDTEIHRKLFSKI